MKNQLKWVPVLLMLASGTAMACPFDLSDAPDSYATLIASNGARHQADPPPVPQPILGTVIDCEPDGQPTPGADGDDILGNNGVGTSPPQPNDEDGVVLADPPLGRNQAETFNVTVSQAAGLLDAWCDFDDNGTFAVSERIANNLPVGLGVNPLIVNTPNTVVAGDIICRFRLSTTGVASFDGIAPDGEVEDHLFTSTPVELMQFQVD